MWHRSGRKQTALRQLSHSFWSVWKEFGILLRLVGLFETNTHLYHWMSIQGREPYLCDLFKRRISVDLCMDIYGGIAFKLGMMIENTYRCISIPVWMTLTFIECHICMRNLNLHAHFCVNFSVDLDEIQQVATICSFIEAHARFVMHNWYLRERSLTAWFYKIRLEHWPALGHLGTGLFQTWYDVRHE